MKPDCLFPYFAILAGLTTVIVAAFTPQGKAQDTALSIGAGLASGGLTAFGLKFQGNDKPDAELLARLQRVDDENRKLKNALLAQRRNISPPLSEDENL